MMLKNSATVLKEEKERHLTNATEVGTEGCSTLCCRDVTGAVLWLSDDKLSCLEEETLGGCI